MGKYEDLRMIIEIIEGKPNLVDVKGRAEMSALVDEVIRVNGDPVVETLVESWKTFGINAITSPDKVGKPIKLGNTLTKRVVTLLTDNREKVYEWVKANTEVKSKSNKIYYFKGMLCYNREITKEEVYTACDIILGTHKVCQVAKELFMKKSANHCTAREYTKLLREVNFGISSVPNLIRLLGYPYINSLGRRDYNYIVGRYNGEYVAINSKNQKCIVPDERGLTNKILLDEFIKPSNLADLNLTNLF